MVETSTSFLFTINSRDEGLTCRRDPVDDDLLQTLGILGSGSGYPSLHLAGKKKEIRCSVNRVTNHSRDFFPASVLDTVLEPRDHFEECSEQLVIPKLSEK